MLIYLHIPFCDSKCHYCAFNSYVDKFHLKKLYMEAIIKQLKLELSIFKPEKNSIKSLFIGGGTPSTVDPKMYSAFFEILRPYLKEDAEITTEANPNSASFDWLEEMKKLGVNRISFGVQSFNEEKLKFLGRNHNQKSAIRAVKNAKKVGFKNISIDLIYGTNLDNKVLLSSDLLVAKTLPINHLSAYSLTIEQNTMFFKKPHAAKDSLPLARFFINEIKNMNLPQYEISNFGTYQSVHNLGYWNQDDYIGIGAGAVGFLKNMRFYPSKDIESYISNPLHRKIENLSKNDLHVERLFLGLRSKIGIPKDEFNNKELTNVNILIKSKNLKSIGDRVFNTDYLLSDELALFISA